MQPPSKTWAQTPSVPSRNRRWMMGLAVSIVLAANPRLAGAAHAEDAIPCASSRSVELTVTCTPAPVKREGVLCLPVTWLASQFGAQVITLDANRTLVRLYEKSVVITPGRSEVEVNQKSQPLPVATFIADGHLYIPAELLKTLWGFGIESTEGDDCKVTLAPARVTDIRYSVAPERVRIVLDLNHPAPFSFECHGSILNINLPSVTGCCGKAPEDAEPSPAKVTEDSRSESSPQPLPIQDLLVQAVLPRLTGQLGAAVQVKMKYRAPVKVFTLENPARIVVDCVKIFEEMEATPIRPGAQLISMRLGTCAGPIKVHVAKIKLRGEGSCYSLRLALAGKGLLGLSSPSEMAKREGGLVTVNGGYFSGNGSPLGNLVIDGEWIKTSDIVRTGLIVTQSGKVVIDAIQWRGRLKLGTGAVFRVDALNAPNGNTGEVVVLTPRWGKSVTIAPRETAISIVQQKVIDVKQAPDEGKAEVAIPEDGFVVCARNDSAKRMATLKPGTRCDLEWNLARHGEAIRNVLSAGPRLVKNGGEHITAAEEKFRDDVAVGRAPRTAVGVTAEGQLLILAAEGRHPAESIGLTLTETARLLIKLGAVDALNLDGGSSTTMVVDEKVISGGVEKRVSDALMVVPG